MAEQSSGSSSSTPTYTSLRALLAAPKGNLEYTAGEAFLLHVFWETPSLAAARTLLAGLRGCATATHRDTPCVPTYFFRIANNNADLCPAPPRTAGEHQQLREAHKKLQLGVPQPAVHAHLKKLGLDPALLELDPEAELPAELRAQPVAVECTELYLDERAFMEHAGSRDYLDSYGAVMNPSLQHRRPSTIRLGTPVPGMVERVLEPVLQEIVMPVVEGCAVWRPLASGAGVPEGEATFLSLDVAVGGSQDPSAAAVAAALPAAFREHCTTCVAFVHPLRADTVRVLCVMPCLPPQSVLTGLVTLPLSRGEAHMPVSSDEKVESARAALIAAGLGLITLNASESAGHALHEQAGNIHAKQ